MTSQKSKSVTEKVRDASAGVCFACGKVDDDLGSPLVAKRRIEDVATVGRNRGRSGGAIHIGRWTYGLYHSMCEVPERLRP